MEQNSIQKGYADIIIGMQFGDEGKGRIVNELSKQYDIIVRYQGGANSGHTIYSDGKKHVLRILPSTFSRISVLGSGVVIDPVVLLNEMRTTGIGPLIDKRCHLTHPIYKIYDMVNEGKLNKYGANASTLVGSTCRGNTATYAAKIMRIGLTIGMAEKMSVKELSLKFKKIEDYFLKIMGLSDVELGGVELYGEEMSYFEYSQLWMNAIHEIGSGDVKSHVGDTYVFLNASLDGGSKILLEGAQGAMLDVDFGTYPDVTSSNCTALGACVGSGISPIHIRKIIGIAKPYVTRVGTGYFPSEMINQPEYAERLGRAGNEFGAVTGRKRKIGAFDLDMIKEAIIVNGVSELIIAKVDVAAEVAEHHNGYIMYRGGEFRVMERPGLLDYQSLIIKTIEDSTRCRVSYYTDSPQGDLIEYK